jgi:hypothetical protein
MANVVVEIDACYRGIVEEATTTQDDIILITSNRLEGGGALASVLVTLTSVSIPIVGKIIIEAIRARRHVCIKKGGLVIKGVTEQTALEILRKLRDEH